MEYRCINSPMEYCVGKPKAKKLDEPILDSEGGPVAEYPMGSCSRNYRSCKYHKTFTEVSQVEVEKLRARLAVNKKGGK